MIPSYDELKWAGVELQIQRLADELDRKARPYLLARLAGDIQAVADSIRIGGAGQDTLPRNGSE